MFAKFKIAEVVGNMERCGSTHAEQNHASIVSQLGEGSAQDVLRQIEKLLERQKELLAKRNTATAAYALVCKVRAASLDKDPSSKAALCLSKFANEDLWLAQKEEADKNYTSKIRENGAL